MNIKEDIKNMEKEIIAWRNWFHQHPGVGFDLEETTSKIETILKEIGFTDIKRYAKTGVVAYLQLDPKFETIALRADTDALPITEENHREYTSLNIGKMHACGHDAHIAMALGAAKYLFNNQHKLRVNLLFIFQPGEEGYRGAEAMLNEGLYDDYPFNKVYGCHIGLIFPELKTGNIGLSYKPTMAATTEFDVIIKGKGGHGAMPQNTVDPIVITGNVITAIQSIVSRNISPTDSAIITFGQIKGGTAHNIIPEKVELNGTIRYLNKETGDRIFSRISETVEGIAKAYGGDCQVIFKPGYPAVVNDAKVTKFVYENLTNLFGQDDIIDIQNPTMGGEDMSYFLDLAPGCFFFLGAENKEKGIIYPHHHPKFDIDEEVLWKGTAAFCHLIINNE